MAGRKVIPSKHLFKYICEDCKKDEFKLRFSYLHIFQELIQELELL